MFFVGFFLPSLGFGVEFLTFTVKILAPLIEGLKGHLLMSLYHTVQPNTIQYLHNLALKREIDKCF